MRKFISIAVFTAIISSVLASNIINVYANISSNDLETIQQVIAEYYNNLYEGDGTYNVFKEFESKTEYELIVRYAMSDQEAEQYLKRGTFPMANIYADTIYVNKETGVLRFSDNTNFDLSGLPKVILKERPISVILNGKELSFDSEPYIENGTTMVPMRAIFEALGASVDYDAQTKTIAARKGDALIELVTDSAFAKINDKTVSLSAAAANKNGSTMVPLRFVSEALGADVSWNGENKTVTVNDK